MSFIDKLGVLGIRSFSPDSPEYIQFYSPCTVIYGPNGSGKTTIIECLKYACTGELPPNSKGGAFIHDVKVAGVAEIKAQIRLQFTSVNKQRMICTRNISLTQKRSTVQQKTLDASLKTLDAETGEMTSISTRCSDLDAEMPGHLGVPRAILDNVVFCHQEESNWPLSEPSVLKKKFDEIFSSTRYTKALENIREVRKQRTADVRAEKVALEALKADGEKARKIRRSLQDLRNRIETKKQEAVNVDEELNRVSREINSLLEVSRKAEVIESQIKQLDHQRGVIEQNMAEIGSGLTDRSETDEELQRMLDDLNMRTRSDEETFGDLEIDKHRVERHIQVARDAISAKHTAIGRLEAAADAFEKLKQERVAMLQKVNDELQLGLSSPFDADQSQHLLRELFNSRDANLQRLKNESRNEQAKLAAELQELKSEAARLEQVKTTTKRQIEQSKAALGDLNGQLEDVHVSYGDLELAKDKLKREESALEQVKATMRAGTIASQLTQKERTLRDLDDQITSLNEEMSRLSRQGDTRTKLSIKRSDYEDKTAAARTLFSECKDELQRRLGRSPSLDKLDKDLASLLQESSISLQKAHESLDHENRELSGIEAKLSVAEQSLKQKQKLLASHERSIEKVCGDQDLPKALSALEEKTKSTTELLASLRGVETMYSRFKKRSHEKKQCVVCERAFRKDDEVEAFMQKLDKDIANVPKQQELYRKNLAEFEAQRKTLRELEPLWNEAQKLRDTEIVELEESIQKYRQQRDKVTNKLEIATVEVTEHEEDKKRLETLCKRAEDVARQQREAKQLELEIDRLESELARTGSTRTVTDCQRELEDLAEESKKVRKDIKRLHDDRDAAVQETQNAENAVRDAREKVKDLQHQIDTRRRIEDTLEQTQKEHKDQVKALKEAEAQLASTESKVERVAAKLLYSQNNWYSKIEEAQKLANEARQNLDRIEALNLQIDEYTNSAGPEQLEKALAEKQRLQTKSEELTQKLADIDQKMRSLEKEMANRKGQERELNDHLRIRSYRKQMADIDKKLSELERQRVNFEMSTYEREMQSHKRKQEQLIDKRGGLHGEIRQMQVQIDQYEQDLSTDYQNVEQRYHDQFIQVKTTELAISDLEKYTKALENAIMRYHTLKMEDLNKLIRELWVNTYRGGDIDYIQIRSDNEGLASNRSYNYRVVMIKNGKELNMRGRCSAGQKVLTSIIIRLALAETFCIQCGVLALDEPTTNLDRENIESLAQSLSNIIQARRNAQTNFQLIVITHDEQFVEYLRRSNVADYFNYVHKADGQYTQVDKVGTDAS